MACRRSRRQSTDEALRRAWSLFREKWAGQKRTEAYFGRDEQERTEAYSGDDEQERTGEAYGRNRKR